MKFGVIGHAGGFDQWPPAEIPGLAKHVEELGFSGIWMQEEHFVESPAGSSAPTVLGSAIAAVTTKLRIGSSVFLLPLHNPLRLAEDIATLDSLSNGRVEFGVSKGLNPRYFQAYRMKTDSRSDSFHESLEFIIRCWTEDSVDIDGGSFKILPKPLQKPHPPIYIGTYNPETAKWVPEAGYRLIQHGLQPRPHLEKMLKAFETAGGRIADVPVGRYIYVSKDDSSARREVWSSVCALVEFFRSSKVFLYGPLPESYLEPERFLNEMVITGSPKTVVEKIKELRSSLGVEYLNCYASMYGYLSRELTLSSLELISRYVIPELAKSQTT